MFDVVGFGALNVDKLYRVNKIAGKDEEAHIKGLNQFCGGSAANTLVGLSRLGLTTGFIGKVSKDQEGRLLIENLKREGVDTEGVILSEEGRSGTVMGFVDPEGQRALYADPGVNDLIKPDEVKSEYLLYSKILHLSSFVKGSIRAQEALLDELPLGVKVSMDPGRIYAEMGLDHLKDLLKRTNILLLNEGELKLLTEKKYRTFKEEIKVLLDYGIDIIVVKCGDKGSYVTDGEESHFIEAFNTKCKDTTGAGDAFNAGFLYGLVKKEKLYDCCLMGNYVAACCVKEMGATQNLPNASQLREMDLDSLS
jgi:ribokinase